MKNRWPFGVFLIVLLAGLSAGCSLELRIHGKDTDGNGDIESQVRTVTWGFTGVVLDGVGDVYIHPSKSYKVVVTTDRNIQDKVFIWVDDDCLHIDEKNSRGFNPTELTIDVYMPEVSTVKLKGVGDIKIASGETSDLKIVHSGVGDIDARKYEIENGDIILSGTGDIKTWVTDTLNGKISGVGDILYKGNPTTINFSGNGV